MNTLPPILNTLVNDAKPLIACKGQICQTKGVNAQYVNYAEYRSLMDYLRYAPTVRDNVYHWCIGQTFYQCSLAIASNIVVLRWYNSSPLDDLWASGD